MNFIDALVLLHNYHSGEPKKSSCPNAGIKEQYSSTMEIGLIPQLHLSHHCRLTIIVNADLPPIEIVNTCLWKIVLKWNHDHWRNSFEDIIYKICTIFLLRQGVRASVEVYRKCIWWLKAILFFTIYNKMGFYYEILTYHPLTGFSRWRHLMGTFAALLDICAGNFTGHRWIPFTKANDVGLWCFLWSAPGLKDGVNNRKAGDLIRHRAHCDVTVLLNSCQSRQTMATLPP